MRYSIKKGHFSSGMHFGLHNGRVNQTYKVRFDSSCMYDDIDWERDWNKLDGWSYNTLPMKWEESSNREPDFKFLGKSYIWGHHINSLRLGWRANSKTNTIELCLYIYQDSVLTITDFCSVDVDKDYTIGVFYKQDTVANYNLALEEKNVFNSRVILTCTHKPDGDDSALFVSTKTIALTKPFDLKTSYKLYPYFGGSNPAPHNMLILSEET